MSKGVSGVPFMNQMSPGKIAKEVKREIKKAERKQGMSGGNNQMNMLDEVLMLSAIGNAQQSWLNTLQSPPIDPSTNLPVTTITGGTAPTYMSAEAAVLKWTANAVRSSMINSYNVVSAQRAEVLMGFLSNGLSGKSKKGSNLFSGVGGLLLLTSLSGGGSSFTNLFGGGTTSGGSTWGGLS